MKTYLGNYLGIVIDNNDPDHRGRVQVFVPHIMPTLYEDWNKKGESITLKCVADNVPEGLSSDIVERLKKILPWAEAASPIIGQSGPGGAGPGLAGAMAATGANQAGALAGDVRSLGPIGAGGAAQGTGDPSSGGVNLDQSPTAAPAGPLVPGEPLAIPRSDNGVDVVHLKPIFVQRLNAFYKEAVAAGYKLTCTSGFRSYEKQAYLYKKLGPGKCAAPGYSTHETGIAVDCYITGPGTNITSITVEASRKGINYDSAQFRALLAKYSLHQPLHPMHGASFPEHWHIEPIEMPAAKKGDRGGPVSIKVSQAMSNASSNAVAETSSSSQLPAAPNPLTTPQGGAVNSPAIPPATV